MSFLFFFFSRQRKRFFFSSESLNGCVNFHARISGSRRKHRTREIRGSFVRQFSTLQCGSRRYSNLLAKAAINDMWQTSGVCMEGRNCFCLSAVQKCRMHKYGLECFCYVSNMFKQALVTHKNQILMVIIEDSVKSTIYITKMYLCSQVPWIKLRENGKRFVRH